MKTSVVFSCLVACSLGALALPATADPTTDTYGSRTKVVMTDPAITSSIKAAFKTDRVGGLGHVRVETEHVGVVTLEGEVETKDAANRAIAIAMATPGVREVRNELEIDEHE